MPATLIQKLFINYSARRHESPYLLDGSSKDGYHSDGYHSDTAIRFHLSMPIFVLPLAHSHWKSLVTWTGVIKFWGPRENGAPRGPRILTFWGPHCDFGAPFELVQRYGREESWLHKNVRTCQDIE